MKFEDLVVFETFVTIEVKKREFRSTYYYAKLRVSGFPIHFRLDSDLCVCSEGEYFDEMGDDQIDFVSTFSGSKFYEKTIELIHEKVKENLSYFLEDFRISREKSLEEVQKNIEKPIFTASTYSLPDRAGCWKWCVDGDVLNFFSAIVLDLSKYLAEGKIDYDEFVDLMRGLNIRKLQFYKNGRIQTEMYEGEELPIYKNIGSPKSFLRKDYEDETSEDLVAGIRSFTAKDYIL